MFYIYHKTKVFTIVFITATSAFGCWVAAQSSVPSDKSSRDQKIASLIKELREGEGEGVVGELLTTREQILSLKAQISSLLTEISHIKAELKNVKDSSNQATETLKTELTTQLKANRKEVYSDIVTIVHNHNYPIADVGGWHFEVSHLHQVKAQEQGYIAGVRNGHHGGTPENVGSIRLMPKALVEKAKRINEEQ